VLEEAFNKTLYKLRGYDDPEGYKNLAFTKKFKSSKPFI
jgi:hypothetical protein